MDRRQVLKASILFAGATVGLGRVLVACSSDPTTPAGDAGPDASSGNDSATANDASKQEASLPDTSVPDTSLTDASSADAGSACTTNGIKNAPINDPLHSFTAPPADVIAGVQKSYSIKGTQTHDHQITLSAANFISLQKGQSVTVTSTTVNQHSHSVTVVCA